MNHDDLVALITDWGNVRNIDNPDSQMIKLMEEVGELAEAYNKGNREQFIDTLGDIQVVMIILASQLEVDYEDSLYQAWRVIEKRIGETVNGSFIKEEDLN